MKVDAIVNPDGSPFYSGRITNNNGDVIKFEADGDKRNNVPHQDGECFFLKVVFSVETEDTEKMATEKFSQVIKINNPTIHGSNDLYMISAIIYAIHNIQLKAFKDVKFGDIKISILDALSNKIEQQDAKICTQMEDVEFIPEEGQNIQNIVSLESADSNIVSNVNNIINDNLENGNNNINHNIGGQMQGEDNNNIFAACWNNCTAGLQSLLDKIKSLCID